MARRNAGAKAQAEGRAADRGGEGSAGGAGLVAGSTSGKSLVQLQAERMAEDRFTALMSSAGVPVHRMANEVLYMLPRGFVDAYAALFMKALTGDDGGAGARGKAGEKTAALGRAARKTHGGGGKKYKKYWTVMDEGALDYKETIDKRLRGLGRQIALALDEAEVFGKQVDAAHGLGEGNGGVTKSGVKLPTMICESCAKYCKVGWKFCPSCGGKVVEA